MTQTFFFLPNSDEQLTTTRNVWVSKFYSTMITIDSTLNTEAQHVMNHMGKEIFGKRNLAYKSNERKQDKYYPVPVMGVQVNK